MSEPRTLKTDKAKLEGYEQDLRESDGGLLTHHLAAGEVLAKVQTLLAKNRGCLGEFGPWLSKQKSVFLSRSTAYDCIAVHKAFGTDPGIVQYLGQFTWTALVKLSGENQARARQKALKRAEAGEWIGERKAGQIVNDRRFLTI